MATVEIDWATLAYAVEWYRGCLYTYVEVPWIVPSSVNMLTCPDENLLMKIAGTTTSLVGSAEQSFLKMEMDGKLIKGRYVACSPCFRVEDSNDGWHFPTFMKVELYRTDATDIKALYEMVASAEAFFKKYSWPTRPQQNVTRLITHEGIDLLINGIEVGSYGIRTLGGFSWIYGTGLALPRYTQAVEHGSKNISNNTGQ